MVTRKDNRKADQLRPIKFTRGFTKYADGSVLVEFGDTKVITTAIIEDRVPRFLVDSGKGWLTAEYALLPGSAQSRIIRDRGTTLSGRTQEIQRLIGRSLRAAVDLSAIGERTITIDADVIQADGGTRTASISGAYIALYDALLKLKKQGKIKEIPIIDQVAAISLGVVKSKFLLDLDYNEDSNADVDANIIMTASGKIIEFQITSEKEAFDKNELIKFVELGEKGIKEIIELQNQALGL
ncbi:MAG: ribonuclease PH [Candidatus Melainabacteria bacterium GWF2_32_7]|nr:MAG: ribonuclease PH [Candidatus Melainabacteria bacterium GWF2_32_7]